MFQNPVAVHALRRISAGVDRLRPQVFRRSLVVKSTKS